MTKIIAERYHDISCGHRVVGHEHKCKYLHGHNYRFTFTIEGEALDSLGRVIDFGVMKSTLCEWLENHYDHKFLMWADDPYLDTMMQLSEESMVVVPFNPTAENIAKHFLEEVAPQLLEGTGSRLIKCRVDETRKCSATAML